MDVSMIDWMARELTGNADLAVVTVTHDRRGGAAGAGGRGRVEQGRERAAGLARPPGPAPLPAAGRAALAIVARPTMETTTRGRRAFMEAACNRILELDGAGGAHLHNFGGGGSYERFKEARGPISSHLSWF
jgi:hypothetical protein